MFRIFISMLFYIFFRGQSGEGAFLLDLFEQMMPEGIL